MTAHTHATAPTHFVEAAGIRFAYRRFGEKAGTPLVFLQHFRGGMDNWDPMMTDGLAGGRPVVLFDNVGVAASTGETPETIEAMGDGAAAFIVAWAWAWSTSSVSRSAAASRRPWRCATGSWCAVSSLSARRHVAVSSRTDNPTSRPSPAIPSRRWRTFSCCSSTRPRAASRPAGPSGTDATNEELTWIPPAPCRPRSPNAQRSPSGPSHAANASPI